MGAEWQASGLSASQWKVLEAKQQAAEVIGRQQQVAVGTESQLGVSRRKQQPSSRFWRSTVSHI